MQPGSSAVMIRRRLALALLAFAWALPPAEAAPVTEGEPRKQVDGDAAWTSQRYRESLPDCRPPEHLKIPRGPEPEPCEWQGVHLASEAPRPMLCRVRAEFAYVADPAKTYTADQYEILHPGDQSNVQHWRVATDRRLLSLTSYCAIVPVEPPAAVQTSCSSEERLIQDSYPPGPARRGEEGDVEFEYSTVAGERNPTDLRMLRSSGHRDLDRVALRMIRLMRVVRACPGERQRRTIRFRLVD